MGSFEQYVFISYAWGGESEEIVNQIDQSLQKRGLKIIRDKRDSGYKDSIKKFMERIGEGSCVIVVISDNYLRSPNCMFELVEIAEHKKFLDRIFPVVLADANIYDPVKRLEYVKHWEEKKKELGDAMKSVDPANLQGIRDDIDDYDRFRDKISGLTSLLKDMNTLTPEMHRNSNFDSLYQAIDERMRNQVLTIPEINTIVQGVLPPERKKQVQRAFENIQRMHQIQQTLYEWKELHNSLDDIITSFAPFFAEVNAADKKNDIPSITSLRNLWYAVSEKIDALLYFASNKVNLIGKRYKEENENIIGEIWAVKISNLRTDINTQLGLDKKTRFDSTVDRSVSIVDRSMLRVGIKPHWWKKLVEHCNEFNHAVANQMHYADKMLRETATGLYDISKSVFGSEE